MEIHGVFMQRVPVKGYIKEMSKKILNILFFVVFVGFPRFFLVFLDPRLGIDTSGPGEAVFAIRFSGKPQILF